MNVRPSVDTQRRASRVTVRPTQWARSAFMRARTPDRVAGSALVIGALTASLLISPAATAAPAPNAVGSGVVKVRDLPLKWMPATQPSRAVSGVKPARVVPAGRTGEKAPGGRCPFGQREPVNTAGQRRWRSCGEPDRG